MKTLLDIKQNKRKTRLKIVQIGESGTGKTHRALSAVEFGPILFLDFDDKVANTISDLKLSDEQLAKIHIENFSIKQNSNGLDIFPSSPKEMYASVEKKIDSILAKASTFPYATVVVDTFSRWNEIVNEYVKEKNGGKMNIPGWTEVKSLNIALIKKIFSLPANIIINAHVAEKENVFGELTLTAGGAGSSSQMLPEFVDECHYLFIQKGTNKHLAQGKGSGKLNCVKTLNKGQLTGLNFKDTSLAIFKDSAICK